MASIKKRPNGKWRARYFDSTGKQHEKNFARQTDAKDWIDSETAKLVRGDWTSPREAKITVREWCDQWLAGYGGRAGTVRQAKVHINLIVAEFGDQRLAEIRPSQVKAWTRRMEKKPYEQSYVYATYRRLAQIMGDAVHDGVIPRSPCSRKVAPEQGKQRPYVATTEQVWALYDEFPKNLRSAILLGAFAGLRVSEAAGLRVSDVDFLGRQVNVTVQYQDRPVKTDGSADSLPIPDEVVTMLSQSVAVARELAGDKATHVVTDAVGRPSSPWAIERAMRAARAKVEGLPEGFRFHDLRHFYASTLIAENCSAKLVQECLRHESIKTTYDTYGHLLPKAQDSARAALARAAATRAESGKGKSRASGAAG